jgi:RNAse (barnase) inhibitor barstar
VGGVGLSGRRKPVLVIDGAAFDDFEGFAREFSKLLTDYEWAGNLDAFDDILRGGFGTPEDGFILRWINSDRSRETLGYPATVKLLEQRLERCHSSHRARVSRDLAQARRGEGPTVFDMLVEIIREHGQGGSEAEDGIDLELM